MRKDFPLVMVSGQRTFENVAVVLAALSRLFPGQRPTLRQGGATGADKLARTAARTLGWHVEPDWVPRYAAVPEGWDAGQAVWRRVAPLRRTEDMLDGVNGPERGLWRPVRPDLLVVFRQGPELSKGGTGHATREARKRGIPMIVYEWPAE